MARQEKSAKREGCLVHGFLDKMCIGCSYKTSKTSGWTLLKVDSVLTIVKAPVVEIVL